MRRRQQLKQALAQLPADTAARAVIMRRHLTSLRRLAERLREDAGQVLHVEILANDATPGHQAIVGKLRALGALLALEVDAAAGVEEVLGLSILWSGHVYLTITNVGTRPDDVTTMGTRDDDHLRLALWDATRRQGAQGEHGFDRAARGPRRRTLYHGAMHLIDRGVYQACDLIAQLGGRVLFSCEGHPGGGYFGIAGAVATLERLSAAFAAEDFEIIPRERDITVYMPDVADAGERDRRWRSLGDRLSALLTADAVPVEAS